VGVGNAGAAGEELEVATVEHAVSCEEAALRAISSSDSNRLFRPFSTVHKIARFRDLDV
jgi:hypothetical protein